MQKELHSCFVDERKERVVPNMVAIVEVGNADGNVGRKREMTGQCYFDTFHAAKIRKGRIIFCFEGNGSGQLGRQN